MALVIQKKIVSYILVLLAVISAKGSRRSSYIYTILLLFTDELMF